VGFLNNNQTNYMKTFSYTMQSKIFVAVTTFAATFMLFANVASAQTYPYYYQNTYQPYPCTGGYYDYNCYPSYNNNNFYNNYSYNYPNYQQSYSVNLYPTTYAATNASYNTATINGYANYSSTGYNYGNYTTGYAWFEYGLSSNSLNYTTNRANIYSSTSINANLTNLSCGTTYYYRAVTSGSNGTQYGSILSFTTASCYNNYYSNYIPYYNYYNNNNHGWRPPRNIPTNCSYNNSGWVY
jgi:hypothetical protein